MRLLLFSACLSGLADAASAESLVAIRPLAPQTVLSEADLTSVEAVIPGAVTRLQDAVGLQVKRPIPAGRPILDRDIGPAVIVGRNEMVRLRYIDGALEIASEGRALDKGGAGEVIRVMNVGSRSVIQGRVLADGSVAIGDLRCETC